MPGRGGICHLILAVVKGKPPVATGEKDEPWAPVVSVATGTLPYTEYDPPLLLSTPKVIWSDFDSPRARLLG